MQHHHSIHLTYHDNLPLLDEGFDEESLDAVCDPEMAVFVHPESPEEE